MRVEYRNRRGKPVGTHLVMISDNHVQSERTGKFHFACSGDTTIGGDQERGSLLPNCADRILVESVTLFHPFRKSVSNFNSKVAKKMREKCRRSHPINVVIAEDVDRFFSFYGFEDTVDGEFHPRDQERVMQGCKVRLHERLRFFNRLYFTVDQKSRHDRRHFKRADKIIHLARRRAAQDPLFV